VQEVQEYLLVELLIQEMFHLLLVYLLLEVEEAEIMIVVVQ
tara:strand:+ start:254 stop:376 length:123 start_codon:yes stop_codon:yes gene_type:complete